MLINKRNVAISHSKAIIIPKSWITNAEDNLVEDWKIIEKHAGDKQSFDNSKDPVRANYRIFWNYQPQARATQDN